MTKRDKLIDRFKSLPKDFSWDELVRMLSHFGFEVDNKGKTSGSRISFHKGEVVVILHKPHPGNILKPYQLRQVKELLTKEGLL